MIPPSRKRPQIRYSIKRKLLKMRRLFIRSIIILLAFLVLLEVVARWAIGLGTPPLSIVHANIDYMFAPNQDVYRFGNRQLFNEYGMRSPSLQTLEGRELVLVFRDSVLNGGNLTDHEDLATTRATDLHVFYGNVSAGSWGPGNHRAWMDTFGLFDADAVLFLYSSHDLNDQPEFTPLNPSTHPISAPVSAVGELITRYLPRYLPAPLSAWFTTAPSTEQRVAPLVRPTGMADLETMFAHLSISKTPTCVLLHPSQEELAAGFEPGKEGLIAAASNWSVPIIDLAPRYAALNDSSKLYRPGDGIHIGVLGQELLTEALKDCKSAALPPISG